MNSSPKVAFYSNQMNFLHWKWCFIRHKSISFFGTGALLQEKWVSSIKSWRFTSNEWYSFTKLDILWANNIFASVTSTVLSPSKPILLTSYWLVRYFGFLRPKLPKIPIIHRWNGILLPKKLQKTFLLPIVSIK